MDVVEKKEKSQLGETIDYDEDKEVSQKVLEEVNKPIYESGEGPLIKGKKPTQR